MTDLFSRDCNCSEFTQGNELILCIRDADLPQLRGFATMNHAGTGINIPFLYTSYMVSSNLDPPHKHLIGVHKNIGSRTTHTFCKSYRGAAMQNTIGLVDLWRDRHFGDEVILTYVCIRNIKCLHQGIRTNGITNLKYFFLMLVHANTFAKNTWIPGDISDFAPKFAAMKSENPKEKRIQYISSNTYATLNTLQESTHTIWIVFHGIGYLSRFFLNYFSDLPADEHFIIAPQAPSKYYLNNEYKHVGASWLTRERTLEELQNVLAYVDAVMADQSLPVRCKVNILGYSQGASIALRWLCHSQHRCDRLILYAGGIPHEITAEEVDFLSRSTGIYIVYGKHDEFLTVARMAQEEKKIQMLFGDKAQRVSFDGGHEVRPDVIARFA